ncbi:DUF418 domain-containing protein [Anaeromicropila herbilytica]|uniref:DUF418 domain-containing protein n=1 Tax=Anaeromicropila herbilytica TaxID=2785025 RepID=A0A7R7EIC0_9FIRM|nr:DUF418 domain-containing protein [Anaeromicropila herbilytica]BCN29221.1 hypothetical protein bsdtb5_05160 [Anaeromicropila herbilytica]
MMNKEIENPIMQEKQSSKRLIALDAARGLAVIGMFIQHFALNQRNSFVSGNTMILFILCSGISYSIMSKRMRENEVEPTVFRARILARTVFIDLVGYILILLNGPFGVVLPAYAMLFIFALLLIRCSTRALIRISCILFIVSPPIMILGLSLFHDVALLSDIAGGPLSGLAWAPVFVAGMAIGRLDLHNTRIALRLITIGITILIPFKLIATFVLPGVLKSFVTWYTHFPGITNAKVDPYAIWPMNTQPPQWQMLFVDMPQGGSTFELLIGTGGSLIILGLLCLISKKNTAILKPFSAVGRVALTLYVVQFVIAWGFNIVGIDVTSIDIGAILFGDILVAIAVLIAGGLLTRLPIGPLESLIRHFEGLFSSPSRRDASKI